MHTVTYIQYLALHVGLLQRSVAARRLTTAGLQQRQAHRLDANAATAGLLLLLLFSFMRSAAAVNRQSDALYTAQHKQRLMTLRSKHHFVFSSFFVQSSILYIAFYASATGPSDIIKTNVTTANKLWIIDISVS